jgi:hypothetical protein
VAKVEVPSVDDVRGYVAKIDVPTVTEVRERVAKVELPTVADLRHDATELAGEAQEQATALYNKALSAIK